VSANAAMCICVQNHPVNLQLKSQNILFLTFTHKLPVDRFTANLAWEFILPTYIVNCDKFCSRFLVWRNRL